MPMDSVLAVTAEQHKLLASPLRLRILHAVAEVEATAAEVADRLGESRGNVHYHLQKLLAGGLVTVVRTEVQAGHAERHYRAVATRFRREPSAADAGLARRLDTWVHRTPEELDALVRTLEQLLTGWEQIPSEDPARAQTLSISVQLARAPDDPLAAAEEEEEDEGGES